MADSLPEIPSMALSPFIKQHIIILKNLTLKIAVINKIIERKKYDLIKQKGTFR
jgi:hypothetical protein